MVSLKSADGTYCAIGLSTFPRTCLDSGRRMHSSAFLRSSGGWISISISQRFWYVTRIKPPARAPAPAWYQVWLKTLAEKNKHTKPSRDKRNEDRERKLSTRQLERRRIMSSAFHDREISEKVALAGSEILNVNRGDVLVGQGGRYLHPRLFKVI